MTEEFDAAELVEELAEKLAPKPTGPKYISVAPALNRAQRRKLNQLQRRRASRFETWKRQLNAAGINWEDVLTERAKKKGIKIVAKEAA